jgi:hypothetical protein
MAEQNPMIRVGTLLLSDDPHDRGIPVYAPLDDIAAAVKMEKGRPLFSRPARIVLHG